MAAPPLLAGGTKLTVTWALPGVAVPIVGAPGTTAATAKLCVTVAAGGYVRLPAWSAAIVHVPAATNVSTPPLVMVHTPVVDDVNIGVRPDVEVAVSVGDVP